MVGETYQKRLKKLNIETVNDLIHHFPHRWEDRSLVAEIATVQPGEEVTIQGSVVRCRNVRTRRGKKIQKAVVRDDTGQIRITWFNQPYLPNTLKSGTYVSLSGEADTFRAQTVLVSPEYEKLKSKDDQPEKTLHTGRLVPIYPETRGVSSKWLRSRIHPLTTKLLPYLKDWLPEKIKEKENLIELSNALKQIHFPDDKKEIKQAKLRLGFNELFLLQLNTLMRKKRWKKNKVTNALAVEQEKILNFIESLPFQLTAAQKKATKEILSDLQEQKPMNRLLEGDVGSGKTVVAAAAIYTCYLNNYQSALMAPTEILAEQHFKSLETLFSEFEIKIGLITSNQIESNFLKSKNDDLQKILNNADLIIGTHSLIYDKINFDELGLAVIDEQHRFGVQQRGQLIKKGHAPHTLTMTATPIPRTIALTMYGDLDLSVLDEMPKGRKKVKTWVVPQRKRAGAYQWIEKQIKQNKAQAFVICPLIEESDKGGMEDLRSAEEEYKKLSESIFPNLNIGLLHGKIKADKKNQILRKFRKGKTDILVATQVVEVGIDIPNATIMIIEEADRFGLAQLHQLRGRVGRSNQQSYCLLFSKQKTEKSKKRLNAMQQYNSGFKLAEIDLEMRGPGEIYGKKQSGWPDLKIASYSDQQLISTTRKAAKEAIEELDQFPLLKEQMESYKIKFIEPN
jgi:ATP-dependent DNA helicase RecG